MALISIILSLLLDRVLHHMHDLRDLSWFEPYTQVTSKFIRINNGWVKLFAALVLPLALIVTIQIVLSGLFFGSLNFLFGIIVLFYCLGPACLSSEIDAYLDARSIGDEDEAMHYAGTLAEQIVSTAPDQQTNEVTRAILSVSNERAFSLLFWFVLIGPFGAALYRLVTSISKQEDAELISKSADLIQITMSWLPARMLALGYALTGHFDGAIQAYRSRSLEVGFLLSNNEALVSTGMGALRYQRMTDEISCIRAARDLVMRAIVVWIAVLSLLTLGGWLG
jgi:AmpE protein